jgi:hypothetical protein
MGERFDEGRTELCIDTPADRHGPVCDAGPADAGAVLRITYDSEDAPSADQAPAQRAQTGHLVVGDRGRADDPEPDFSAAVATGAVPDPTDLDSLGTAIGRYMRQWADEDLAICFDSVTALLTHVDEEAAVQFLGLFIDRLERADAVAHFHLDAGAHDDATVEQLADLVDTVEGPVAADGDAGVERSAEDSPSPADASEDRQRVADGGRATGDADRGGRRPAAADIDEATDQEVAERYADL